MRSLSMRGMMRISGPKLTIAIWPTFSLFKARSPRRLRISCSAKLSPTEKNAIEQPPTADVTAFDLYSRAKTLLLSISFSAIGRQKMLEAVELLNQAIARDPSFFLAHCQLAYAHDQLYFIGGHHSPAR